MSRSSLRVMVDTGNAPAQGGIGVYSRGLVRSLRDFGSDTLQVSESPASLGATRWRPLHRVKYFWRLRELTRNGFDASDIVHFTNAYVPESRNGHVPYMTTICDLDPVNSPELYPPSYRQYARFIFARGIRRADMVLTISKASRDALLERYAMDESRVRAIGIGISPDLLVASQRVPPAPPEHPPMLLFVGAIAKKKNLAWLVRETAAGVRSGALPRLRLVLAGNLSYGYPEILRELKSADGIAVHVNSPSLDGLVGLYQSSSAVVLPSFTEGFGLPLIEAMYFDRPIVASRIPSSVEVAGETASFFPLNDRDAFYDAVRTALFDSNAPVRRAAISRILPCYLWENLVPHYITAYRDCIAGRR